MLLLAASLPALQLSQGSINPALGTIQTPFAIVIVNNVVIEMLFNIPFCLV